MGLHAWIYQRDGGIVDGIHTTPWIRYWIVFSFHNSSTLFDNLQTIEKIHKILQLYSWVNEYHPRNPY